MQNRVSVIVLNALLLVAVSGCQTKYIPNTELEDNEENRGIVEFCERYRHAVEDLNVGLLLSLASPRYFDNSGTPSGDDDYDRAGLETILNNRFRSIKSLRFEFKYRDIFEQNKLIFVEYTYTMSFQYEVDGKTKWHNRTADKRLELERVEDSYLIVSGM